MRTVCLTVFILIASVVFAADIRKLDSAHEGMECVYCHLTENPSKRPPVKGCFECHESYAAVAGLTDDKIPNPHDSHQGELRCGLCHKPHAEDKLYCNECHDLQIYKFN